MILSVDYGGVIRSRIPERRVAGKGREPFAVFDPGLDVSFRFVNRAADPPEGFIIEGSGAFGMPGGEGRRPGKVNADDEESGEERQDKQRYQDPWEGAFAVGPAGSGRR